MKAQHTRIGMVVTLACSVSAANAAEPSATLRQFQGRVFVGQASAITPAAEGMRLYSGDRLVAVAGAGAQVVYSGGCTVVMPESSILAIAGADQCRAGQAAVRTTAGFQHKVVGQTGLDSAVLQLVSDFDTLSPNPLVSAFNRLSDVQQGQLVGALSDTQLTKLYVAIRSVSGRSAAQGFLALLSTGQADAVVAASAAAGGVGGAGLTIGAITLTAAEVGAVLGLTAVAAIAAVGANESGNSNNTNNNFVREDQPASQ